MNDEKYVFITDCAEKKRTAGGERSRNDIWPLRRAESSLFDRREKHTHTAEKRGTACLTLNDEVRK